MATKQVRARVCSPPLDLRAQYTRAQRIVVLAVVFVSTMAVVAMLYGYHPKGLISNVATTVFASLVMLPCRYLLPHVFRWANAYPALPRWKTQLASAATQVMLALRRSRTQTTKVTHRRRYMTQPNIEPPLLGGKEGGVRDAERTARPSQSTRALAQPHECTCAPIRKFSGALSPTVHRTASRLPMSPPPPAPSEGKDAGGSLTAKMSDCTYGEWMRPVLYTVTWGITCACSTVMCPQCPVVSVSIWTPTSDPIG